MSAGERGAAAEARRLFRARDAFQCPELDVRMKKYLVRLANETANHLIQDTLEPNTRGVKVDSGDDDEDDKDGDDVADDDDGDVDPRAAATNGLVWKKLSVIKGIQLLRGYDVVLTEDGRAKDVACCLRGLSVVNASIEEFAMLFKLDTNRNVATEHGLLFNPDLLDMATLYALVQPSGDHPRRYVGIKWCLVQSPSKLFRNRDFCYLECQKEFRDAHGRRGWVRSMHSIKMPCCPSLEKTHGIVRASMYRCGLVAVETKKPGVLRVTYTVEMDLKGHFPEIFQPNFLAQRIASLASIDKFLQQQRLSSSPLLGDLDIPANKKSKASCHFCYRNFSMLLRKHVCRKCGECVCKNCSSDWDLDVPVIGRKKVRICTVCSVGARFSHVTASTSADGYIVDRQTSAAAVPPQRQHREEIEAQAARPHQRRSLSFSSPSDFHHLHYQQQQQQQHHYGQRNEEQRFQSIQFGRPTATRKGRRASQPDPHPYQPSHFAHHASRQEPEFRPAHEYRGTNDMLDFEEFTMDGGVGGHNVRATTDLTGMWDPREDGLPTPMDSPASYFGIKHRATSEFEQQAPQYNHHSSQQVGPSRESILFQQQAAYEEPPPDSFSEHHQSDLLNRHPPPQRRHTANYTSLVQQQQHQQYLRRHDLHHEQHNPYFGHPQEPEHQQQYQQQQQQARRRQQSYPSVVRHNSRQPRATENYPQQRHRQQSDTEMYFPPTQVNGTNRNFALEFFKEQYKNSAKQQHNEQRTSEQSRPAQPHPFMQLPAQQLQTDHHSVRRSTRPSSMPSSRPLFQHNVQRMRSSSRAHEEQRQPDPPLSPDQTQTPGEVIEYVETEDGEWVEQRHTIDFPIPERERAVPRSVSIGEDSEEEEDNSMHLNPGYCIHCGSKRVVRNGVIEAACICELTRIQAPKAASGAFEPEDRDMDQSPVPQRRKHAADDGDHVVPLLVGRTSQQTMTTLYGRVPHKTHSSYAE